MRIHFPNDRGNDTGATMIWVALLSIVIFGMASFAIDAGVGFTVKRKLSATADSAALAGAMEAANTYDGYCDQAAIDAAVQQNHAANVTPDSAVATTTVTCEPDGITVIVNETSTHPTIFGRILGAETLTPAASAAARVTGTSLAAGMRPWSVCLQDALYAYHHPNEMMVSFFLKDDPKATISKGCLNGGSQSSGYSSFSGGSADSGYTACLIKSGYGSCSKDLPTFDVGDPNQYEPFRDPAMTDDRATTGAYAQADTGHNVGTSTPVTTAITDFLGVSGMPMTPKDVLLPTAEYWEKTSGAGCSQVEANGCYEGFGAVRVRIHGYWLDKGNKSAYSPECDLYCDSLKEAKMLAFPKPRDPYFMIFWKYAGPNWVSKVDLTTTPGNLCFDEALCNIAAGLVPAP